MAKRGIIIGSYNTAAQGWTLASWSFSDPEYVRNFVDIEGRIDGPLDLSARITNGEPRYKSRTFTATLECSEGNRLERENMIQVMTNWLDGWRQDIELPDDSTHYITGRVSVAKNYSTPAHASVTVTAVCDPWRYEKEDTIIILNDGQTAMDETATVTISGRRTVVPLITIEADNTTIIFGGNTWTLSAGQYKLPDISLSSGEHQIQHTSSGLLTLTYREAIL